MHFSFCCPPSGQRNDGLFRGQNEGYDETIEPQNFSKDEDEDHADEEARLLCSAADSGISHNADGKAGSQAAQSHAQSCSQVQETPGG